MLLDWSLKIFFENYKDMNPIENSNTNDDNIIEK